MQQQLSCVLVGNRYKNLGEKQKQCVWQVLRRRARLLLQSKDIVQRLVLTTYYDTGNVQAQLNELIQLQSLQQDVDFASLDRKRLLLFLSFTAAKLKAVLFSDSGYLVKRILDFVKDSQNLSPQVIAAFLIKQSTAAVNELQKLYFKRRLVHGEAQKRICSMKATFRAKNKQRSMRNQPVAIQEVSHSTQRVPLADRRIQQNVPSRQRIKSQTVQKNKEKNCSGIVRFLRQQFQRLYRPMNVEWNASQILWVRSRKQLQERLMSESLRRNERRRI